MSSIMDHERLLPVNVEAERSVLGGIMIDPKAYDEAAALGLTASDFSIDSHRRIYLAMQQMGEVGSAIDLVTICNFLGDRRELEPVGGAAYISALLEGVPERPGGIKHHIQIVKRKADARNVAHACNAAIGAVCEGSSAQEIIGDLSDRLLQIQTGSDDAPAERVLKFSEAVFADWKALANGSGDVIGLTTGIDAVDLATTGIRAGETWAIGGRPGDGKTSLGLQIAAANCRLEVAVGYFSIEMSKSELLQRLWSHEAKIPFGFIRNPSCASSDVRSQVLRAMTTVARWPLFVAEDGSLSLQKLVAKARLLIRREKIALLVVDYVQLISAVAPNERERITKISGQIRALAKDTGVPIVAVSQLSRPKDRNQNDRPNKFSMRESSALESDANTILLIYRPADDSGRPTGEDEIIIAKQRHGPVGLESVFFDGRTMTFFERKTA